MTVGQPYPDATEAFVARATLDDGTPAVLKAIVPRDDGRDARDEITVLRLASGDGCVRLLRSDAARGVLLTERLGPSLHDIAPPLERQHEILAGAAQRIWRPASGSGLRTGAQKGRWLAGFIVATWAELDRPCPDRTVAHAMSCLDSRIAAHDDDHAVLVHGDVHAWNALEAGPGEFKLVDPDGLLAEPEYDLGIIMREDPLELMQGDPFDRAAWLAELTGLDATAIWEWGVAERVSTGLILTRLDVQPIGRQMLESADRIARTAT